MAGKIQNQLSGLCVSVVIMLFGRSAVPAEQCRGQDQPAGATVKADPGTGEEVSHLMDNFSLLLAYRESTDAQMGGSTGPIGPEYSSINTHGLGWVAQGAGDLDSHPWNNFSLLVGLRESTHAEIGGSIGLEYSSMYTHGLGWEAGFIYSRVGELFSGAEFNCYELNLGARYTYPGGWNLLPEFGILPYIGLGVSGLLFDLEHEDEFHWNGEQGAFGGYLRLGVNFLIFGHWTIGADVRGIVTTGEDLPNGMLQAAVMTGISF